MPALTSRGRLATLLILGAALLALAASAPAANAATIYACVKVRGGSVRLVSSKTKCRRGEAKLSWNTVGPDGKQGTPGRVGASGAKGQTGAKGDIGVKGETGAKGETGPPATALWGMVGEGGGLARSGAGVLSAKHLSLPGEYEVVFNRSIASCAYVATLASPIEGGVPHGTIGVAVKPGNPDALLLETDNTTGTQENRPFSVAVFC